MASNSSKSCFHFSFSTRLGNDTGLANSKKDTAGKSMHLVIAVFVFVSAVVGSLTRQGFDCGCGCGCGASNYERNEIIEEKRQRCT